ncbi:MAG: nicotinate-nucleotide--dimethylbenzimidazole phosphoribosyltransferase [Dissulfurispiraceae bacterium]|jgi:nicotinate-nucleotide--dimethylbenzimidazole phosphoribosyltransferase|nr:nicotinate-nucleotide--dimethylbenzimidazole phosphoribosyltransferase [Dissulfurispiraceae bacterium]
MQILKKTIEKISPLNNEWFEKARQRLDSLTKPPGSLGRLEEFAARLVAIREDMSPTLEKKAIFTFAADHGITDEGVSAFPKEVTRQMVFNFLRGGAGINVLGRHAGAEVVVVDIGVAHEFEKADGLLNFKVVNGTRNFCFGPAMTRDEAVRCIETGIEIAEGYARKGCKIFGTGEMGIGNTTPSSAITSVITGRPVAEVTGRGTGINDHAHANKVRVIEKGIQVNKPSASDAIDVLAKVGGAEIGGIAGLILGAASLRIPVVVDGFISTAGALIAYTLKPECADYMFAAHGSVEPGHKAMLDKIGLKPILDLNMRLGEGTGAAVALLVIEAGLKIYREMATFGEAGVASG